MYVDLYFLLIIYVFSCVSMTISIYALWTLYEIKEYYRQKEKRNQKTKAVATTFKQAPRAKGLWN
jgi:hypothetical protein